MEISSFTPFFAEDISHLYSTPYPELHTSHLIPFDSSNILTNDGIATDKVLEEEGNTRQVKVKVKQMKRPSVSAKPTAVATFKRRPWVKDRPNSKDWWEKFNHPDFPDNEFKKEFRMSKATFDLICNELEPIITKKNTTLRTAIPVRQRVAVCIWRLATGESLRKVADKFGIGLSTCRNLVQDVCLAIKTVLIPKFLLWPDETDLGRIKSEFESVSKIPNIGGSMYTTHIPIVAPELNVDAYLNKRHTHNNRKCYSISVQGVVDPNGVFIDVSIGWPGSMSDDQVLEKSPLFQWASQGLVNNTWIVGNSGYPLLDWVLVPCTNTNLMWTQHTFNEKITAVQEIARKAFWRLKRRWGCLQKRTEVNLQDLAVVLEACCVLHNICEKMNDGIDSDREWTFEFPDDEVVPVVPENPVQSAVAFQQRDYIAHHLLHRT